MSDAQPSAFRIQQAVRVNTPAYIAFAGPAGSGKTRSALELATGLAAGGKILFADTEGNRALHYADLYRFDHVEWRPPFTPERNAELIELAEQNGYAVLIIDSESDEWEGEGGLLEIAAATKDEFYARTKMRHKHKLINRMRRAKIHIIFCLRAEERVGIDKVWDDERRKEVVKVIPKGWEPICEKRFMHEVQSSFLFDQKRPGVPVRSRTPTPDNKSETEGAIKLYDIHAQFFPPDKLLTRETGRALAAWAAGAAPAPAVVPSLYEQALAVADDGTLALERFWRGLGPAQQRELASAKDDLKARAALVDEARPAQPHPEPPSLQFAPAPAARPKGLARVLSEIRAADYQDAYHNVVWGAFRQAIVEALENASQEERAVAPVMTMQDVVRMKAEAFEEFDALRLTLIRLQRREQ